VLRNHNTDLVTFVFCRN